MVRVLVLGAVCTVHRRPDYPDPLRHLGRVNAWAADCESGTAPCSGQYNSTLYARMADCQRLGRHVSWNRAVSVESDDLEDGASRTAGGTAGSRILVAVTRTLAQLVDLLCSHYRNQRVHAARVAHHLVTSAAGVVAGTTLAPSRTACNKM